MALTILYQPPLPNLTKNVVSYQVVTTNTFAVVARVFVEDSPGAGTYSFLTTVKCWPDANGLCVFYFHDLMEVNALEYDKPTFDAVANWPQVCKKYRMEFYEDNTADLVVHDQVYAETTGTLSIDALTAGQPYLLVVESLAYETISSVALKVVGLTVGNASKTVGLGDEFWYAFTPAYAVDGIVLQKGAKATIYAGAPPTVTAVEGKYALRGGIDYNRFAIITANDDQLNVAAPSDLAFAWETATDLRLSWTDNSNNEVTFQVQMSTDGAIWTTAGTTAGESLTVTDLDPSTEYYFRVRAVGAYKDSTWITDTITTPAAGLEIYTLYEPGVGISNLQITVGNVTESCVIILPDGTNLTANALNTADEMFDGTSKLVQILLFDADPYIDLTFARGVKPTGVLDLSGVKLKSFYQEGDYQENIGTVTSFLVPTQTEACSIRILQDIFNGASINLTGLSNLQTYCVILGKITSFTYNPTSSNSNPIDVEIRNTASTTTYVGSLNLSKFTNMTQLDIIGDNLNMTDITIPATNAGITQFRLNARHSLVNGSSTLDLSTLTANAAGLLYISCAATYIKMPSVGEFTTIEILYCKNLSGIDVTGLKMAANTGYIYCAGHTGMPEWAGSSFVLDFTDMAAFTGLKFICSGSPFSSFTFGTGSTFREFGASYLEGYTATPDYSNLRFSAGATRFYDVANEEGGAARTITLPSVQQTVERVSLGNNAPTGVSYSPADFTQGFLAARYDIYSQSADATKMDAWMGYIYAQRAAIEAAFPTTQLRIDNSIAIGADYYPNSVPSGTYQAPSGFVKNSSDGTPASAQEQMYVLVENYDWAISYYNDTLGININLGFAKQASSLEMFAAASGQTNVRKVSGSTYLLSWAETSSANIKCRLVTLSGNTLTKVGASDTTLIATNVSTHRTLEIATTDFWGFLLMYRDTPSSDIYVKLFEIERNISGAATGVITERHSVICETDMTTTNIPDLRWLTDNERVLMAWAGSGNDGYAQAAQINLTTKEITLLHTAKEYDTTNGTFPSIGVISSTKAQIWSRGAANDGWSYILAIDATTGEVTVLGSGYEFDISDNSHNGGLNLSSTRSINFWAGVDDDGFVQMFSFDSTTGAITALDSVKEFAPNITLQRARPNKLTTNYLVATYAEIGANKSYINLVHYNTTTGVVSPMPQVELANMYSFLGNSVVSSTQVLLFGMRQTDSFPEARVYNLYYYE